jgi:hypothetical protein
VHVQAEGVVAPGDVLQVALDASVVVGVDYPLLLPRAPGVGARRCQESTALRRQPEQVSARLALAPGRVREVLAAAGANLDLRLDQLAGDRLDQQLVLGGGIAQLGEAMIERARTRVEDRELLLDPDREVD